MEVMVVVVVALSTMLGAVVAPITIGLAAPILPTMARLLSIVFHSRYSSSTLVETRIERPIRRNSGGPWTVSHAQRLWTWFVGSEGRNPTKMSRYKIIYVSLKDPYCVYPVPISYVQILVSGKEYTRRCDVCNSHRIGVVSHFSLVLASCKLPRPLAYNRQSSVDHQHTYLVV
jgi:hypothetical protein